jgi:hypothetical protein
MGTGTGTKYLVNAHQVRIGDQMLTEDGRPLVVQAIPLRDGSVMLRYGPNSHTVLPAQTRCQIRRGTQTVNDDTTAAAHVDEVTTEMLADLFKKLPQHVSDLTTREMRAAAELMRVGFAFRRGSYFAASVVKPRNRIMAGV